MGEAALPPVLQLGDLEAEDEAAAHDSQKWLFPCGASAEEALVCSALAQHVCVSQQPVVASHRRATLAQFMDGIRPGAGAELQAALDAHAPAPADPRPRSLRARARRPSGNSMPAEALDRGHHQSGRMYEILLCAVMGVCQRIARRKSDAPPELPMDPSDGTLACGAEGGAGNWLLDEFASSFGVSRAERGTALLLACLATCRRISLADDVPSAALLSLTCVALSAAVHHREGDSGGDHHGRPQRSARWRPRCGASDVPASADSWCRDALRAAGAQLREYVVSQLPLAIGGCDGGDDDSAAHASLRSLLQLLASTCQLDGGASGAHRAVQDDLLVAALQRAARIELEQETHAAEQTVRFAHQSSTGSGESF